MSIKKIYKLINTEININLIWQFSDRVIRMILGVLLISYSARLLGPVQFGGFNYVVSLIGIFSVFASLGIQDFIIKELVKNDAEKNQLLSTTFFFLLISASLTYILLLTYIHLLKGAIQKETITFVYIFGITLFFKPFESIQFYFDSKVISKKYLKPISITFIFFSILKLIYLFYNSNLFGLFVIMLLETFANIMILLYLSFCSNLLISLKSFNTFLLIKIFKN